MRTKDGCLGCWWRLRVHERLLSPGSLNSGLIHICKLNRFRSLRVQSRGTTLVCSSVSDHFDDQATRARIDARAPHRPDDVRGQLALAGHRPAAVGQAAIVGSERALYLSRYRLQLALFRTGPSTSPAQDRLDFTTARITCHVYRRRTAVQSAPAGRLPSVRTRTAGRAGTVCLFALPPVPCLYAHLARAEASIAIPLQSARNSHRCPDTVRAIADAVSVGASSPWLTSSAVSLPVCGGAA
jgi:hypothetical protein